MVDLDGADLMRSVANELVVTMTKSDSCFAARMLLRISRSSTGSIV